MSVTAHLHGVKTAKACRNGTTSWIIFESSGYDSFSIFMPLEVTIAVAAAFNTAMEATNTKQVAA